MGGLAVEEEGEGQKGRELTLVPGLEHPREREETRLPRLARNVAVNHKVGIPCVAKVVAVVEGDLQAEGLAAEPWSRQYVHYEASLGRRMRGTRMVGLREGSAEPLTVRVEVAVSVRKRHGDAPVEKLPQLQAEVLAEVVARKGVHCGPQLAHTDQLTEFLGGGMGE